MARMRHRLQVGSVTALGRDLSLTPEARLSGIRVTETLSGRSRASALLRRRHDRDRHLALDGPAPRASWRRASCL